MSFVTVRDIFQSYNNRPIIERVNIDADEGEFVSIVGASGCGKSTLVLRLPAHDRARQHHGRRKLPLWLGPVLWRKV